MECIKIFFLKAVLFLQLFWNIWKQNKCIWTWLLLMLVLLFVNAKAAGTLFWMGGLVAIFDRVLRPILNLPLITFKIPKDK